MANETTFTLTFKTIAQLTGLDQLMNGVQNGVKELDAINNKLSTLGTRVNQALGVLGLGLGIHSLNEYGNKALEVGKQQAAFTFAVLRSKDGSAELVETLTRLNEELEQTTGTSKGTSRSIEQLFLRAGADSRQVKDLTRGVIEFAASSAGTVQPLELAAVLSRRLSGAADAADISLGRLGIRAKDINGIIKELATRGGDSAEALVRASGGMTEYEHSVDHAEIAIGRLVNTVKIPFLTAFTGSLTSAKEKLDGVTKSAKESGDATETWGVKFAITSAIVGHSLSNIPNLASAIFYAVATVEAAVIGLVGAATITISQGVEKAVVKAIDLLGGLAKFAASTANTLSGGLIKIDPAQIDQFAEQLKTKLGNGADAVREKWVGDILQITEKGEEALAKLQQSVDAMTKGGPKVLDQEFFDKVKAQMQQINSAASNFKNVKPGSGVIDLGDGSDAGKAKAATDALAQSKLRLASAEQTYKGALETTKLLEESGQITRDQASQRNIQATRDYIAELERAKAAIPGLIAQMTAVGNNKGAAEAKLEYQQLTNKILEAQRVLQNTTVFGKIRSQIRQLADDWSDVGKQVGGFLTQQFQNFASTAGNAIGQLIFRTGNLKQTVLQLGQSFVSSLATMLIQWVLSRTIMSALNKAFGAADAAAAQGEAGAAAAAWAPAATAASIASYGAAAGLGLSAYLSAIATGTAATVASSGFMRGGFTGDGPPTKAAGVVHMQEVVFPKPAVDFYGKDFLVNMAVGNLSRPTGYQSGGAAGSRPGSGPAGFGASGDGLTIINVNDWDTAIEAALKKRKGRTIIVDTVNDRHFEVGG